MRSSKKKESEEFGKLVEAVITGHLVEHEAEFLAKELVEMGRCPTFAYNHAGISGLHICPLIDPAERTVAGCIACWRDAARKSPKITN